MRIVLDTNVLVAGLLSPFGPCGDIVRMVVSGGVTLCVDARVLSEYREVLGRPKFRFDEDKVEAILDYIAHRSRIVASAPLSLSLTDPGDEPFLETAISGGAEYLVTGNAAHFPPHLCQGAAVVSPAQFLKAAVKREKKGKADHSRGR